MSKIKLYFTLLKTCGVDALTLVGKYYGFKNRSKSSEKASSMSVAKKTALIAGAGLLVLIILFYLAFSVFNSAVLSYSAGVHVEFLYSILFFVQLIILFFGAATTINYLYYGKDNSLLQSLPVSSGMIFSVKFTLSYFGELIISFLTALPCLVAYGIGVTMAGGSIDWSFYLLSVIGVFLLPIFPLLIISIISIPLMYLVSMMRNRTLGKTLIMAVTVALFLALYFIIIFGAIPASDGEETFLSQGFISGIQNIAAIGIYNYGFVNALLNNNAFVNIIIYLAGLIGIFALGVILSLLFYAKGISFVAESSSAGTKRKKSGRTDYATSSFIKSFARKEIKTILGTPALLLSCIMGFILLPAIIIFYGKLGMMDFGGEPVAPAAGFVGFVCFFVSIMLSSTNYISLVGFSMEGKNINILKSLPIAPRDIIKVKLLIAVVINLIMAVVVTIACIIAVSVDRWVAFCMLPIFAVNGFASAAMGLYNDLKNPNYKFVNINELTKNYKKAVKPMLLNMFVGIIYFVEGMIFSMVPSIGEALGKGGVYAVLFLSILVINLILLAAVLPKLNKNAEEFFYRTEV